MNRYRVVFTVAARDEEEARAVLAQPELVYQRRMRIQRVDYWRAVRQSLALVAIVLFWAAVLRIVVPWWRQLP